MRRIHRLFALLAAVALAVAAACADVSGPQTDTLPCPDNSGSGICV